MLDFYLSLIYWMLSMGNAMVATMLLGKYWTL